MKNIILASVAAISLGGASMALAGGPDQPINTPAPNGGFYAGISVGAGALDLPSTLLNSIPTVVNQDLQNNWGFAGRVELGYLMDIRSNMLVGAEIGYNYLPQSKYTFTTADVATPDTHVNGDLKYTDYSFDVLGVAKYLLQDGFNVFGKAGFALVEQTAKGTVDETSFSNDLSKVLPEVVIGAGYDINSSVEATVAYAHVFGDDINDSNAVNEIPSYDTVLFGVDYKFAL